jgi:hypothetical protein
LLARFAELPLRDRLKVADVWLDGIEAGRAGELQQRAEVDLEAEAAGAQVREPRSAVAVRHRAARVARARSR